MKTIITILGVAVGIAAVILIVNNKKVNASNLETKTKDLIKKAVGKATAKATTPTPPAAPTKKVVTPAATNDDTTSTDKIGW